MVITLFACAFLWEYGNEALIPVIWMKVGTNSLIGIWFHFFRGRQLYFYYNLGFSSLVLYCSVFLIDFLFCIGVWYFVLFARQF